jgi:hypothetical protein
VKLNENITSVTLPKLMGEVLAMGEVDTAYDVRAMAERSIPKLARINGENHLVRQGSPSPFKTFLRNFLALSTSSAVTMLVLRSKMGFSASKTSSIHYFNIPFSTKGK